MDNQTWDKTKLTGWKKFWESEMGAEAIKKMQTLRNNCFNLALNAVHADEIQFYTGRAAGIDIVLQDIEAGIRALDGFTEPGKEEAAAEVK